MKRTMIAALLMATPALAQTPVVNGDDLFVDLDQYLGQQVIILDAFVFSSNETGSWAEAGSVTFRIEWQGADRESQRYLLKTCGLGMLSKSPKDKPECVVSLLGIPIEPEYPKTPPRLTHIKIVKYGPGAP